MERFLKKGFQTVIALIVISIFPIIFDAYISSSHIHAQNSAFVYPLIVAFCISTHNAMSDALDYYLKSEFYINFVSRYILIFGSLICDVIMVAAMSIESSLGSLITFVTLQIQVILILMGLTSYLDKFLVGDKWELRLGNFSYFFLLASICLSTMEYMLIIPNKFPITFTVLALSLLSGLCLIGTIYLWYKYCCVTDIPGMLNFGLNINTHNGEGNMALMATLCIAYSAAIILNNVALIYPRTFNIQKMNLVMSYLNCIFVYAALLQEGIIARMNIVEMKV